MNAYIQTGDNNFHKITDGKCVSINTERGSIKINQFMPSSHMSKVKVITEEIYESVLKTLNI